MFAKIRAIGLCHFKFGVIFAIAIASALMVQQAAAGVSLIGTRVIYNENQGDRTLQFRNSGDVPHMMQIWIADATQPEASPEQAESPFVVTPQIFRIDGQQGQVARLILPDSTVLPSDQESVFYLSFSQLPALSASNQDKNQLIFMLISRIKLFYRPAGLVGSSVRLGDQLKFSWADGGLRVENPTVYHVSSIETNLIAGDQVQPVRAIEMIAPRSTVVWPAQRLTGSGAAPSVVRIGVINDYGTTVYSEHTLP